MEEYRFEHREPLTQRVVLALRVNLKQLKERLWLGRKYKVGAWINLYSRSWKRTMLHRSNFKEQKPLSSSSEKKQASAKSRFRTGNYLGAFYELDDRTEVHYSGNLQKNIIFLFYKTFLPLCLSKL